MALEADKSINHALYYKRDLNLDFDTSFSKIKLILTELRASDNKLLGMTKPERYLIFAWSIVLCLRREKIIIVNIFFHR